MFPAVQGKRVQEVKNMIGRIAQSRITKVEDRLRALKDIEKLTQRLIVVLEEERNTEGST